MKKYLILLILVSAIGVLISGVYLPKNPFLEKEAIFSGEKGEGSREISLNLEKEKLIKWSPFFRIYVLVAGVSGKLQAGKYLLSPSMNIPEIAEKFVKGEAIKEKITIIEGWNLRDIGFYFERKAMFQAEELWEVAGFPAVDYSKAKDLPAPKDFSLDYDFLREKLENIGLEGYLFPDTYEVGEGASIEEIVRKMLDNVDQKLAPYRPALSQGGGAGAGQSIFEVVTMAALGEEEVKAKEDKK